MTIYFILSRWRDICHIRPAWSGLYCILIIIKHVIWPNKIFRLLMAFFCKGRHSECPKVAETKYREAHSIDLVFCICIFRLFHIHDFCKYGHFQNSIWMIWLLKFFFWIAVHVYAYFVCRKVIKNCFWLKSSQYKICIQKTNAIDFWIFDLSKQIC